MLKNSSLLVVILCSLSCIGQEIKGTWISYEDYLINNNLGGRPIGDGFLIDFDNKALGHLNTIKWIPIDIDFKESKLIVEADTVIRIEYKYISKDSIEVDTGANIMTVFKPLDLSYKLNLTKSQISDFLIKNKFEPIGGEIDVEFSMKLFLIDVRNEDKKYKRNTLINKSSENEGYWYIREIHSNFFLVFTFEGVLDMQVFQILSLENCKLRVNQIEMPQSFPILKEEVTELKTCL